MDRFESIERYRQMMIVRDNKKLEAGALAPMPSSGELNAAATTGEATKHNGSCS